MTRIGLSVCINTILFTVFVTSPTALLAAGPDTFGYLSTDSNTAGGPVFSFTDISTTGTRVTFFDADALPGAQNANGDDGVALDIPLTIFNNNGGFPFYGTLFTKVNMSTNGFLHFELNGTSDSLSNNCPIQNAAEPNSIIAVAWDDLVLRNPPSTIAGGFFQVFNAPCPYAQGGTGNCVVFQWDNCDHFGGGIDSFDIQAVLYDTGNILMLYPEGAGATPTNPPFNPEHGSGSTTGLEKTTASDSLTHVCDTANSLPANFAVLFTYPAPRVSLVKTVSVCVADPAGPGDPVCNDICGTDTSLSVTAGTNVKYCYTVANTGTTSISGISIVDDKLGVIPGVPANLAPGANFTAFQKTTINGTVINTATLNYTAVTGRVINLSSTNWVRLDTDADGKSDLDDNSVSTANADQLDTDADGVGDATDNCGAVANPDQADANNDGIGNACDPSFVPPAGAACGTCAQGVLPATLLAAVGLIGVRRALRRKREARTRVD